jgi:flagellar hook-basal body complex protein FliE
MKVEALIPDAPAVSPVAPGDAGAFASALDAVGSLLSGAQDAEDAFAAKRGSLQAAVYERARADVALSVATAAAQRAAQAISSVLNMQV